MAYGDFIDLTKRTASDKILRDKVFNIAKNTNYDGYQRRFASIVYNFFGKNTSASGVRKKNISNKELAKKLQKPIIKQIKKRKVYSSFIDYNWAADLADMQVISKFNN